jgi:hypothetical protein
MAPIPGHRMVLLSAFGQFIVSRAPLGRVPASRIAANSWYHSGGQLTVPATPKAGL